MVGVVEMKRGVVKKKMRRILNRELPTMIKISSIHVLVKVSSKSSLFKPSGYPCVRVERFSTSLHKGVVTVSKNCCVDEIAFSTWHSALTWICKQTKCADDYDAQCSKYIVDSGHYRYRVYFLRNHDQ